MLIHAIALLLNITLAADAVITIGDNRQIMVDRHLIDTMTDVQLELGTVRDEGTVFTFDQPWEGPFCGYATIIQDGNRFLLYYRGLPEAGADGTNREVTCVAVSDDGLHWSRPRLNIHEVDGSRDNNVILADAAPVTHNFSPFLDAKPGIDPDHRFKALGGNEHTGLIAYTSPDGLHWTKLQDEPVVTDGMFDSQNVAFWSDAEQQYNCYLRTWTGDGYSGYRTISRSTSPDFIHWSKPIEMTFGETPPEHLYTNQTHPYFRARDVYIAIAARFMPGRQVITDAQAQELGVNPSYFRDCSDAVLMTSRGGNTYDRIFMESFIRPGIGLENWVSRSNYPALNIVQTGPSEMSLYVNQNYAQPTAELRRYSMRLDGLASISAGAHIGEWRSHPIIFEGDVLEINFATSARGGIRIEIQDVEGNPIPGFALDDCMEQIGNEINRVVRWKRGSDLSSVSGQPIRLRFVMQDADLYSFRFKDTSPLVLHSVDKIWDQGPHNAFTDLLKHDDILYCTFREGESHVGGSNGTIRVLQKKTDRPWQSIASLQEMGIDLRDPKLSLAPGNKIMLTCGASEYEGPLLRRLSSRVAFFNPASESHQSDIGPLQTILIDPNIKSDRDWLWRVTWHDGLGYGVVYQPGNQGTTARLVSTLDGIHYKHVSDLKLPGNPNETTLRFRGNELFAIIRRDQDPAVLGRSRPPYTTWSFTELPEKLGGPDMIQWDEKSWLVAARQYHPNGTTTVLGKLTDDGEWSVLQTLPSGGDTSYPGIVNEGNRIQVSFYSSHEGKTSIYIAELKGAP